MNDRPSKTGVAHTPGPWVAKAARLTAGHETIAHFGASNSFRPPRPDECVANVRLCAAAPDLLEWAEKVLEAYMPQFSDSRAVDDVLVGLASAVAKATTPGVK